MFGPAVQHAQPNVSICFGLRPPAPRAPAEYGAAACHTWRPPLNPPARLCRNSEIYNHQQLREAKLAGVDLHSKSDSAVVGYLYQK